MLQSPCHSNKRNLKLSIALQKKCNLVHKLFYHYHKERYFIVNTSQKVCHIRYSCGLAKTTLYCSKIITKLDTIVAFLWEKNMSSNNSLSKPLPIAEKTFSKNKVSTYVNESYQQTDELIRS